MAAYAIFIRNSISDPEEMKIYGGKAAAARGDFKLLAAYGPSETMEGQKSEGQVLIEFKSMEDARAWYNSAAYQDALQHRLKGADYRVIFFEGL